MKEEINLLVELQETDSLIIGKTSVIDSIPKKVSSAEQPLKDALLLYEKHKQTCEALEKKKREKETAVEEINEKIKKLNSHMSEIKTNKEYQAFLKEKESMEKERYTIEDGVLSLMESIDAAHKELKAEDAKVGAEKEKIEAFKNRLNEEVEVAKGELDGLKLKREKLVEGIDKDLYKTYFELLKSKRGVAIVEARDEICRGCNMNIPPQLFVEIRKNEEIIQCPQCKRILYWKE